MPNKKRMSISSSVKVFRDNQRLEALADSLKGDNIIKIEVEKSKKFLGSGELSIHYKEPEKINFSKVFQDIKSFYEHLNFKVIEKDFGEEKTLSMHKDKEKYIAYLFGLNDNLVCVVNIGRDIIAEYYDNLNGRSF